jgi:NAD(P)-dependent dehydrogenase (short-subunit alcohol dehydrogenase family)
MDLGINGRWALVCGASKGLGLGCARALVREGVNVVIVARGEAALQIAAEKLRALPGAGEVRAVAADVTTEAGRAAALAACPQVDILVTNAGGPPPGDFRSFERDDWIAALDANMLAPIALIRATVDAMIERGFGRIVNITSSAVKAPIDILALSNGARSGLTGFVAGLCAAPWPTTSPSTTCCPASSTPTACAPTSPTARASRAMRVRWQSAAASRSLPAASARRTSSAPPAPSCAAHRPVTSPGRTC